MATEILLTSEAFVKGVSSISDNIAGKYLRPSIREAQDVQLRRILGDTLLAKLKELVGSDTIDNAENADYKTLLDRCQYFIAYTAVMELTHKVTFKVVNAGVVKTPDEHVQVVEEADLSRVQSYYQAKADSACLDLQNYILNNWALFLELTEGDYHRVRATLYSAASSGLFLGGARGKGPGRRRGCK